MSTTVPCGHEPANGGAHSCVRPTGHPDTVAHTCGCGETWTR